MVPRAKRIKFGAREMQLGGRRRARNQQHVKNECGGATPTLAR